MAVNRWMLTFIQWTESRDASAGLKLGQGWAIIGVDHGKTINIDDASMLEVQKRFMPSRLVWHEGKNAEPVVLEFVGRHLPGAKMRSWEPVLPRMPSLAIDLFGGTKEAILRQIESHRAYDPGNSIIDNLLATQKNWRDGNPATVTELKSLLSDSGLDRYAGLDMSNFGQFHRDGFRLMWKSGSTSLSGLAEMANKARQERIKDLAQRHGGVFFAGRDHLENFRA